MIRLKSKLSVVKKKMLKKQTQSATAHSLEPYQCSISYGALQEEYNIAGRVQEVFQQIEKEIRENRSSKEVNSSILM